MIVLPMLACQMRTTQMPSRGTRVGSTRPLLIANGPGGRREVAAVAAPVDERLVDRDLAEQVVDVVIRLRAPRHDHALARARRRAAHAVDLLAVRVGAADHAQQQRVARRARHLRGARAGPAGGRTRPCWCRRACRWRECGSAVRGTFSYFPAGEIGECPRIFQEVLREALQHAAGLVDRDFLGGVEAAASPAPRRARRSCGG